MTAEFDDVSTPFPGWATSRKASAEIYRLAEQYQLTPIEFSRERQYRGTVNGVAVRASVFDRDAPADLASIRAAIAAALQQEVA